MPSACCRTIAYALLFLLLRGALGAGGANIAALAITAVATPRPTGATRSASAGARAWPRHHVRGAFVFVLTVGLTTGALAVLHGLDAAPARWVELAVLIAASLAATVTRYVAFRTWVFARRHRPHPTQAAPAEPPVLAE